MAARLRWAALLLVPALSVILSKYSRSSIPGLLPPVVLVPGYATNELDARLTELYRPSSPRCAAHKGQGWFRLYLDHASLNNDPAGVRCFAEQMSSVYDAASGDYHNVPGVETRVPFFGCTRAIRHPDPDRGNFSYTDAFVSRLERVGYRDGETLFGAPYDFRYAVPSIAGDAFFAGLKGLVEKASRRNAGHRPGAQLRRHAGVPVPAPATPAVAPEAVRARGRAVGRRRAGHAHARLRQQPRPAVRRHGGAQGRVPEPAEQPLGVAEPGRVRSYTAHGMVGFLEATGMGEAVGPYETRVLPLFRELPSPRVPVACVVGVGVDTPEMLAYPGDNFDVAPRMVMGDGDGLVNLASLVAVDPAWRRPAADFSMVKLRNVSHTGLLVDDRALAVIINAILRPNN
ncbi:hypothetical protein HU200_042049 [Digitaria exilis]|uniref:Lecithin-cholesterol acyltransferase-like 1 n=1 Tax=Digitaria exilis TaxID=1010633 RepID=A0A835BGY8_9POAL|nr:hypothetical protein HU200_042049 [Digitaria exilis]CAB3495112.1 unnamed protein product [Digitaria exilis]